MVCSSRLTTGPMHNPCVSKGHVSAFDSGALEFNGDDSVDDDDLEDDDTNDTDDERDDVMLPPPRSMANMHGIGVVECQRGATTEGGSAASGDDASTTSAAPSPNISSGATGVDRGSGTTAVGAGAAAGGAAAPFEPVSNVASRRAKELRKSGKISELEYVHHRHALSVT